MFVLFEKQPTSLQELREFKISSELEGKIIFTYVIRDEPVLIPVFINGSDFYCGVSSFIYKDDFARLPVANVTNNSDYTYAFYISDYPVTSALWLLNIHGKNYAFDNEEQVLKKYETLKTIEHEQPAYITKFKFNGTNIMESCNVVFLE